MKMIANKEKILIHICCAPCSAGVMPELKDEYNITGFFYNPNIDNVEEYQLRKQEMERFSQILNVPVIFGRYDPDRWHKAVKGFEKEPERGKRCEICFKLRLEETARIAEEQGFPLFCTTLTLSPLKNAKMINLIGNEVGQKSKSQYLESDFKKKDGFKKSIERSREYNLYRQNYCGCSFSKRKSK